LGANVTAASAGSTPPDIDQIQSTMNLAKQTVAAGGMKTIPSFLSAATRLADMATKYEQPVKVDGSLMSRGGEVLGTAPVRDPYRVQGGNVLDTTTGEASMAPAQQADLARKTRLDNTRIQEILGRDKLNTKRGTTEDLRAQKMEVEIQRIVDEIAAGSSEFSKEGITSQLTRINDLEANPETTEEQKQLLLKAKEGLLERLAAMYEATQEGASDNDPDSAEGNTVAEGGMVPSHSGSGLRATKTGQVYDYVPGQGLRPR